MVNPDRDDIDQETEEASNRSPDPDPALPSPTRRKPIIVNDVSAGSAEDDPVSNGDRSDGARRIRPPRKEGPKPVGDLEGKQQFQGKRAGDRYVRVVRQQRDDFERAGPGHLVATPDTMRSRGPVARGLNKTKRVLIGAPLTTASAAHERLTKVKALAVLSSDALSSVA